MKNILIMIVIMDIIGYIFWQLSGQTPLDSFHLGIISESLIKLII